MFLKFFLSFLQTFAMRFFISQTAVLLVQQGISGILDLDFTKMLLYICTVNSI